MESLATDCLSILDVQVTIDCFRKDCVDIYRQGCIDNISSVDIDHWKDAYADDYIERLRSLHIKAYLAVPILQGEQLWGLLIAHQCTVPRQWEPAEIALLQRLATQVSIAIQQSELYEQTQRELLERERIRKILEKSEQRLQAILDHAPAAIYLIDLDNKHLLVNHQYAELCQTEPQQLLGKSIDEVWPASVADTFAMNNQTVITTGQLLKLEEVVPHPDGQPRTYITVKFPLKDTTGTLYAICGISTDITEQKQLEAQFYRAQRLESLGTLASGIAHDLNNIFTPILACVQLVRMKHPDLEARSLETPACGRQCQARSQYD